MDKLMAILIGFILISSVGGMMVSDYYKYDLKRIEL